MVKELEITVKVDCSYEQLHKKLLENNFKIKEKYQVNDIYMVDNTLDISTLKPLEVLKRCILVRDIVGIQKELLYKYKKYDEQENIIEQGKVKCPILDINKAVEFMQSINYKTLFKIFDNSIVYCNDDIELAVQLVNDQYIFIEMENKAEHINREFHSINEMINAINKYDLPFKRDNYFVKKAEIILKSIL